MSRAGLTLVCFAVKQEAAHFRRLSRGAPNVEILVTGMGRRNAEQVIAAALQKMRPQWVITAGFAGALIPELARGAVVFSNDHETELQARLRAVGARSVRFHCAERVVSTAAEKRMLHFSTGADAVEMESAVIHLMCRKWQIPATTVRVILDTAAEDLAFDFNRVMTADQRIDGRKLALALLKAPWRISGLLRLQKQSAAAARRLGDVLAQALELRTGYGD